MGSEEEWRTLASEMFDSAKLIFEYANIPMAEKTTNSPKTLSLTFLARSMSHLRAILLLLDQGMLVEARTILRNLFEGLIRLGSLTQDGPGFVKAMKADYNHGMKFLGQFVMQRREALSPQEEASIRETLG